jgi:prolyl 4-hydroxylase
MKEILSIAPRIVLLHNVLSVDQCTNIINSDLVFEKSQINRPDKIQNVRDSYTYRDINGQFNHVKSYVVPKLIELMPNVDFNKSEPIQIQKYSTGQQYLSHVDYFDKPVDRIATAIIYLNDDFIGGETMFTRLNIKVKPMQGSMLFFYYGYEHKSANLSTEHASLPIISGTKQIITVWFNN